MHSVRELQTAVHALGASILAEWRSLVAVYLTVVCCAVILWALR